MPLVKIHLIKGCRSPSEITKLADAVQDVVLKHFAAPPRDRYQIITQHEPYEIICEDTGLGFNRTEKVVIIHIFQQGRNRDQKEALYNNLAKTLLEKCQVSGHDLIISISANTRDDWSFGDGKAQFNTKEL